MISRLRARLSVGSLLLLISAISWAAVVAQDGVPAAVTLTYADAFCLDGKRLRITNATVADYGQPGTLYDTEIAEFSQIRAVGTAGNGPASFELKAKNGLIYEFGATTNSRITPSPSNSTAMCGC